MEIAVATFSFKAFTVDEERANRSHEISVKRSLEYSDKALQYNLSWTPSLFVDSPSLDK